MWDGVVGHEIVEGYGGRIVLVPMKWGGSIPFAWCSRLSERVGEPAQGSRVPRSREQPA